MLRYQKDLYFRLCATDNDAKKNIKSTSSYHFCVIYSRQTPAQIFVSSPENLWHRFHWLPRVMSLIFWAIFIIIFHCCLRQYFIGCLGRYLFYFISAWGDVYFISLLPSDISLVAWGNVYYISLLPSDISLVSWGDTYYVIVALSNILLIAWD